MKRDMSLARQILLTIEGWPSSQASSEVEIPDREKLDVEYHLELLQEAGLLVAQTQKTFGGTTIFVERLTWEGHDFLEAARDDTRWNKALRTISDKGGALVFEVLKQVLTQLVREAVLPPGH